MSSPWATTKTRADAPYSVELCGGTHVERTGDIGLFRIVSESASAAGIRRIEALTGEAARQHGADLETALKEAAAVLKVPPADLAGRIGALMDENRKLERSLAETRRALATGGGGVSDDAREIAGVSFVGRALDGAHPKELRAMVDDLKQRLGSGVYAVVSRTDGKAALTVGVTDDLTGRVSAVDLARAGCGGGGRQGRRRPGRHGAGRRPRRRASGRRAQGNREGARRSGLSVRRQRAALAPPQHIGGAAIPAILPPDDGTVLAESAAPAGRRVRCPAPLLLRVHRHVLAGLLSPPAPWWWTPRWAAPSAPSAPA